MPLSSKSLAGPGYIILNVLRGMNIVGLLAVVTASMVMLIKTIIVSQFFFFDAVSHVITAVVSSFLIVSECSLFKPYFARNWPMLSPVHGFSALGVSMIVLGVNILGNLNKAATSQDNLGMAFWRIVIGSGIIIFVLGFFNIIASFVFRDRRRGITARRVRSKGAVALTDTSEEHQTPHAAPKLTVKTSFDSSSSHYSQHTTVKSPLGSPWKSLNFSPAKTFRAARASILPSYHSTSPAAKEMAHATVTPYPTSEPTSSPGARKHWRKQSKDKRESQGPRMPLNISAPMNVNPQFAHLLQKPDVAHHPSQRGRTEGNGLGLA